MIIFSGCTKNTDNNNFTHQEIESLVVIEKLPAGYRYEYSYTDVSDYENRSENIVKSARGLYWDQNDIDVYLDIIEFNTELGPITFMEEYLSRYESSRLDDTITTVVINERKVTRIKKYTLSGGTQKPRYSFIWNEGNYVFIVSSNSDDENSALYLIKAIY